MTTVTETYLPDERYDFYVAFITDILRQPVDEARYDRLHVALRAPGIEMGDLVIRDGHVRPTMRADLVDAMMKLEPDVMGRLDEDEVRWVLSEHNIWPDSIRDDVLAQDDTLRRVS